MHVPLCICATIPNIVSRARFVFVVHPAERWKTTNTGRIAARGIEGSRLSFFVGRGREFDPPTDLGDAAILFPPRDDEPAPVDAGEWVDRVEARGRRPTIVIPDGTWSQCRKIVGRHDALRGLPRLRLPDRATPRGGLRLECLAAGMSTIDAVAWLIEEIDGPEAGAAMARLHRTMLERTMASRGTPLPDGPSITDLVPGGRLIAEGS